MSAGRGPARELAEVLRRHRLAGLNGYCSCGWAPDLRDRDRLKQHDAHLADVALAWVAEESGLAALADEWDRKGRPLLRAGGGSGAISYRDATGRLRAALAALVGHDGREGT